MINLILELASLMPGMGWLINFKYKANDTRK